jgi:hypothetical protein
MVISFLCQAILTFSVLHAFIYISPHARTDADFGHRCEPDQMFRRSSLWPSVTFHLRGRCIGIKSAMGWDEVKMEMGGDGDAESAAHAGSTSANPSVFTVWTGRRMWCACRRRPVMMAGSSGVSNVT